MMIFVFDTLNFRYDIVGKEENAGYQYFLFFVGCFSKVLTLSLPNESIIVFRWLKIHFHCKVKKQFIVII